MNPLGASEVRKESSEVCTQFLKEMGKTATREKVAKNKTRKKRNKMSLFKRPRQHWRLFPLLFSFWEKCATEGRAGFSELPWQSPEECSNAEDAD